ncbi:hypothetical protein MTR_0200s0020 [Medicago truncatula]|uniref:Uncharacterized protein n=1 Tax=Medicago truncatula TaxID=3880 RepID=A0A072TFU4_MEDTR|nr:hypothetical protein MTR_0200s0020 [Medicago truncatula]
MSNKSHWKANTIIYNFHVYTKSQFKTETCEKDARTRNRECCQSEAREASEGCPSDLVLKSGGPITFDSRSEVSSLAQVWFWAFYGFFRWIGGRELVEAE